MKTFILTILFALQVTAADLNLNTGDVVFIQPNVMTKVTCNGGPSNSPTCQQLVTTFRKTLDYCARSNDPGECAKLHWPKFKSANPQCVYAAVDTCLEYCSKTFDPGECANNICI